MIILHEFALSSASYRVRIALRVKGIEYRSVSYRLRAGEQSSPQYLTLNPAGLVPTLEIHGLRLTQSLAIIDYLDTSFPIPRLMPDDPVQRAKALSIVQTIACDIHPLNNLRVIQYLEQDLGHGSDDVAGWYGRWIHAGFKAIEHQLHEMPERRFSIGDEPGIIETYLVPQVYNARRFSVSLDAYPRIVAIADRAAALPTFEAAAPEQSG